MPPGSARNASARSSMTCLRSPHGVGDDQLVGVDVGELAVHQRLGDDADGAAAARPGRRSATAPIAETLPPPDTSVQPRSAIASPTRLASVEQLGMRGAGRAVDAHRPLVAGVWLWLH